MRVLKFENNESAPEQSEAQGLPTIQLQGTELLTAQIGISAPGKAAFIAATMILDTSFSGTLAISRETANKLGVSPTAVTPVDEANTKGSAPVVYVDVQLSDSPESVFLRNIPALIMDYDMMGLRLIKCFDVLLKEGQVKMMTLNESQLSQIGDKRE